MKISKKLIISIVFGVFCAVGFFFIACAAYYSIPDVGQPNIWEKILCLWLVAVIGVFGGAFWYFEIGG